MQDASRITWYEQCTGWQFDIQYKALYNASGFSSQESGIERRDTTAVLGSIRNEKVFVMTTKMLT